MLSGEENFNQYFERSGTSPAEYEASYARYGINGSSARGWASVDPRFDLSQEPNEPFRFGWIVELDPYDKDALPRKHTMLGRLKHEGANMALADDGRAVAYMGDDERNDYIYKFVSSKKMDRRRTLAAKRHNMSLLTEGTLYVARFTDEADDAAPEYDGTGAGSRCAPTPSPSSTACPWPTSSSTPGSPPTRSRPPGWTVPRTSRSTPPTARSTAP